MESGASGPGARLAAETIVTAERGWESFKKTGDAGGSPRGDIQFSIVIEIGYRNGGI